jgi:hypothetical protein
MQAERPITSAKTVRCMMRWYRDPAAHGTGRVERGTLTCHARPLRGISRTSRSMYAEQFSVSRRYQGNLNEKTRQDHPQARCHSETVRRLSDLICAQ